MALERLAIVEKQRQSTLEELQAVQEAAGKVPISPVAGAGRSSLQAALDKARADCEAAQFQANEAEAALAAMTAEHASSKVVCFAKICTMPDLKLFDYEGRQKDILDDYIWDSARVHLACAAGMVAG